jgi:CheY-like chemotaxis protein
MTVRLPQLATRHEAGGAPTPLRGYGYRPGTPIVHDFSDLTVLVVDDQPDALALVTHVLEDCGAVVLTAGTAEEALDLVARTFPDILISDIGLPDVDGFELLRRIRKIGAASGGQLPAIALTAFARDEDRARVLRAGFVVHVAKPFDPSDLLATVASVAGRVNPGT